MSTRGLCAYICTCGRVTRVPAYVCRVRAFVQACLMWARVWARVYFCSRVFVCTRVVCACVCMLCACGRVYVYACMPVCTCVRAPWGVLYVKLYVHTGRWGHYHLI